MTEKTFGSVIKDARIARGISIVRLGRAVQKAPSFVHRIEQNKVVATKALTVKLAQVLGITNVDELMSLRGLDIELAAALRDHPEIVVRLRKALSL